jgi:hypothetical protein
MSMKNFLSLLGLVLITGCQSYSQGLRVICDSPHNVPTGDMADPATHVNLARWIASNLSNRNAIALFEALASAEVTTKIEILESESKKAGLASCSLPEVMAP